MPEAKIDVATLNDWEQDLTLMIHLIRSAQQGTVIHGDAWKKLSQVEKKLDEIKAEIKRSYLNAIREAIELWLQDHADLLSPDDRMIIGSAINIIEATEIKEEKN